LIFIPRSGGGKMLAAASALFASIHSEKCMVTTPLMGNLTVPIAGTVERTVGGALSSGPPDGASCLAQEKRKKTKTTQWIRRRRMILYFSVF
jgi:hypothetical protein